MQLFSFMKSQRIGNHRDSKKEKSSICRNRCRLKIFDEIKKTKVQHRLSCIKLKFSNENLSIVLSLIPSLITYGSVTNLREKFELAYRRPLPDLFKHLFIVR